MNTMSVVIPAYGNQEALNHSLATLDVQTIKPHEVIVVDDGSPAELKVPGWVRLARLDRPPSHRGSSKAKNFGASLATGDYLVFADADILHLPDAIESLEAATHEWGNTVLINVMRVGLHEGYPAKYYTDTENLLVNCRTAGLLIDEDMQNSATCWEQNCGLINREYFRELGGYDNDSFRHWGFNNQDLCVRVILNLGHVTSVVGRASTGKRLHCFHIWHESPRGSDIAKQEWIAKWGEEFSQDFMHNIYKMRDAGDSKYDGNIVRAA